VLAQQRHAARNLGRPDEALALEEAMVRRDPVNVTALSTWALTSATAGRLDAAIASLPHRAEPRPGPRRAHAQLGNALLLKGDAQGALAEIEQETSEVWKMIGLPMAYHALGRKADSDGALTALIAVAEKDGPYNIAYVYAYRGEADKAFEWLDKAVAYGDGGLGEIVTDTLFDKSTPTRAGCRSCARSARTPETLAKIEFKVTLPKEWQAEAATPAKAAKP
jgi:tetratricopeptide (TPR) repeat protein